MDLRGIFKVTKIATQGRQDWAQWVTQYKVSYSTDGVNFNFQNKVSKIPCSARYATGNEMMLPHSVLGVHYFLMFVFVYLNF